jgi:hypothetical protein
VAGRPREAASVDVTVIQEVQVSLTPLGASTIPSGERRINAAVQIVTTALLVSKDLWPRHGHRSGYLNRPFPFAGANASGQGVDRCVSLIILVQPWPSGLPWHS